MCVRNIVVKKYSFVFQIKILFIRKCMSPTRNAIYKKCNFLPLWACSARNFRSSGYPGCGMLLQLPHKALSNYLVVDHVAHSEFDASSSPKEKIAHHQVRRTRGLRWITLFTHQSTSTRKLPPHISGSCITGCKLVLIGCFLLIFDNFENVYLFSANLYIL
jgi:hypothetical protein